MKNWQALILSSLLLAGCSKPAAVTDLKAAITALKTAGADPTTSEDRYHGMVADARAKLAAAKSDLSAGAADATAQAMAKVSDVDLLWQDTDDIADGLTPMVEPPMTRLGIVKTDKEFQGWAATFIPLQQSPDDDTPAESAEKGQARDATRRDMIRQAMDKATPALTKAENAL